MLRARPAEPAGRTAGRTAWRTAGRTACRTVVAVAGAAALLVGTACTTGGTAPGGTPAGAGPVVRPVEQGPVLVYVSGLDDHLLEAYETVPLHRAPDGPVVAAVPTGVLAWAHHQSGGWLEVALAEERPARGWIADFYLRGELHLVDPAAPGCPVPAADRAGEPPHHHLAPSTRVRLVDLRRDGAEISVRVRDVRDGGTWWVARDSLSERPGPDVRRAAPGTACAGIRPEPAAPHAH